MLVHTVTTWVIENIWPLVWSTVVVGVVMFYLQRGWGKQTGHLLLVALHPIRLARGVWLCPQCGGTGKEQDHICFFCIDAVFAGKQPGFVTRERVFKDWQWRSWSRKPEVIYPGDTTNKVAQTERTHHNPKSLARPVTLAGLSCVTFVCWLGRNARWTRGSPRFTQPTANLTEPPANLPRMCANLNPPRPNLSQPCRKLP